ncbi:Chromatin assembly factor 1 subunit FAS2 [Zea mays]|uniref:Chromatin assembly factor 1 subunit FAS2 n=1 Tax=Zea mays TaxID=4577 RepID=A0A3L6G849_MAIZE|nr:Chromatin assembly factor 1 subunit FAS2 [Zea mays]
MPRDEGTPAAVMPRSALPTRAEAIPERPGVPAAFLVIQGPDLYVHPSLLDMEGERATRRAYVDASAPPYANRRSPGCSTPAMPCFSPIHHSTRCETGCRISIGTTNNQCSVLSLDFHPISRRLTTAGVDHDVKILEVVSNGSDGKCV